jgi:hypothetical protein
MAAVAFMPEFSRASAQEAAQAKSNEVSKVSVQLPSGALSEEETDVGQSGLSEMESSSGLSDFEASRVLGRRSRFGKTSLETIPGTPLAAGTTSFCCSPTGLQRAALRQARDACKPAPHSSANVAGVVEATVPQTTNLCRFSDTPLGTVPKTPVNGANLQGLSKVFGSPPGLSRTEARRARDACKVTAAWGAGQAAAPTTSMARSSGKRHTAREALARMKEEAAHLKDLKSRSGSDAEKEDDQSPENSSESEDAMDADQSSPSEEESTPEELVAKTASQRCRFGITPLGTVPSTPVGGNLGLPSPPGLSRKAMRQARDQCKASVAASWGTSTAPALTINPSGTPMTPPAARAAQKRVARDAVGTPQYCPGSLQQTPQVPR